MKISLRELLPSLIALSLLFATGALGFTITWWLWGPVEQVYVPVREELHSAIVTDHAISMHREFIITKPVTLHVQRELIQRRPQGDDLRIQLDPSSSNWLPGDERVTRSVEIPPNLGPGIYELHSTVHWRANPLREGVVPLPVLKLEILP